LIAEDRYSADFACVASPFVDIQRLEHVGIFVLYGFDLPPAWIKSGNDLVGKRPSASPVLSPQRSINNQMQPLALSSITVRLGGCRCLVLCNNTALMIASAWTRSSSLWMVKDKFQPCAAGIAHHLLLVARHVCGLVFVADIKAGSGPPAIQSATTLSSLLCTFQRILIVTAACHWGLSPIKRFAARAPHWHVLYHLGLGALDLSQYVLTSGKADAYFHIQ